MRAHYPECKILLFSEQRATLDLLDVAHAQGHEFDLLLKPVRPPNFLLGTTVNVTVAIHAG